MRCLGSSSSATTLGRAVRSGLSDPRPCAPSSDAPCRPRGPARRVPTVARALRAACFRFWIPVDQARCLLSPGRERRRSAPEHLPSCLPSGCLTLTGPLPDRGTSCGPEGPYVHAPLLAGVHRLRDAPRELASLRACTEAHGLARPLPLLEKPPPGDLRQRSGFLAPDRRSDPCEARLPFGRRLRDVRGRRAPCSSSPPKWRGCVRSVPRFQASSLAGDALPRSVPCLPHPKVQACMRILSAGPLPKQRSTAAFRVTLPVAEASGPSGRPCLLTCLQMDRVRSGRIRLMVGDRSRLPSNGPAHLPARAVHRIAGACRSLPWLSPGERSGRIRPTSATHLFGFQGRAVPRPTALTDEQARPLTVVPTRFIPEDSVPARDGSAPRGFPCPLTRRPGFPFSSRVSAPESVHPPRPPSCQVREIAPASSR